MFDSISPEVAVSIGHFRRRASKEWRQAHAEAFGAPSGNQQEDDRRIFRMLIASAESVKKAEREALGAIATWLGEDGDTWPPTPNPLIEWVEKNSRFRDLLDLAHQDPCFTFERLLKIGELGKGIK